MANREAVDATATAPATSSSTLFIFLFYLGHIRGPLQNASAGLVESEKHPEHRRERDSPQYDHEVPEDGAGNRENAALCARGLDLRQGDVTKNDSHNIAEAEHREKKEQIASGVEIVSRKRDHRPVCEARK